MLWPTLRSGRRWSCIASSVLHDVQRAMKDGTAFRLTATDAQRLRDAGASAELLDQIKSSAGK